MNNQDISLDLQDNYLYMSLTIEGLVELPTNLILWESNKRFS